MKKTDAYIWWVVAIIIGMVVFGFFTPIVKERFGKTASIESTETHHSYTNTTYKFRLRYPLHFNFVEHTTNSSEKLLSFSFVEGDEYEHVAGVSIETSVESLITVDVFANSGGVSLREWVVNDEASKFKRGNRHLTFTHVDGEDALRYVWGGDRKVASTAVVYNQYIYVFSVILEENESAEEVLDRLLRSVEFLRGS